MEKEHPLIVGAATTAAAYLLWKAWKSLASVPVCVERKGRLTVFQWFYSPPSRLVHVTTLLFKVPNPEFYEIDLSNGEQLQWWFLRVNPKGQIPACVLESGEFMAESRDLVRHIFDKYNKDPSMDHWYPKDPVKRKAVDEWMDWSKPLHLCVESQVALRMATTLGMPWRENFGIVTVLMKSGLVVPPGGKESLLPSNIRKHLDEAEKILSKRSIESVADLNLGDLTTLQEVCMVFECFEGKANEIIPSSTTSSLWKEYPHLANLYEVFQRDVPEFAMVHAPFLAFCERYRKVLGQKETPLTLARGLLITFTSFLPYVIWNVVISKLYPFGPPSQKRQGGDEKKSTSSASPSEKTSLLS